jgi:hypothetical protein
MKKVGITRIKNKIRLIGRFGIFKEYDNLGAGYSKGTSNPN